MTTFNKLLAIKDGGGNPGSPASGDDLSLSFNAFSSAVTSFGLTASSNDLVAFDAASLDFGNANANPAFNFLGSGLFSVAGEMAVASDALFSATGGDTNEPDFQVDGYAKFAGIVELADDLSVGGDLSVAGISTLTGAVQAQDTLSVTNGLTVGGTVNVTGAVDFDSTLNVDGDATFASNATVNGNLTVLGTLVTKQTESVLISDNYIDMNSDYTTASPQDTGLTFNYSPIASATVTAMDSDADTITLSANSGISLSEGDIVVVTGLDAAAVQNEGLYEVLTFENDVITVNTGSGLTFLKHEIAATVSGIQATLAHVNIGVLRVAENGSLQYGEGSNADIDLGDVPFNGYAGTQSWTSDLFLTAPANSQGSFFSVSDPDSNLVLDIAAASATVAGDLLISNNATSYALALNEAASDPAVDAGIGKVYTKAATTNGVTISELFYTSEIDGVDTPVQITKNGALNIDVLTFSLQEAYNDGQSIVTNAQNGAVSITAGANLTDALSVTGDVDVTGAFDVTGSANVVGTLDASGLVSFASTGGNSNAPDFSVAGYAKISGGLYVDSTLDVAGAANLASSLSVTGATTLSDTLGVTGATTLSDTLGVTGAATFSSTLGVSGATTLSDTLGVSGATTLSSTLGVTGATTLSDTLGVTGAATFSDTLGVTGAATLSSTLGVSGAATLSSTLGVSGATTLSDTLDVTGAATFGSTITGSGDFALKDGQAVDKFTVSAATGNTNIEGTLDVTSTATFDSGVNVGGGLGVIGAASFSDTLGVTGAATLSSTLEVTDAATFLSSVTSNGTLTAENNLVVNGDYISIAEAVDPVTPAADAGSVYVSADPAAAGHAELWYYGDGTANAVMITKDGQLNIDVLTFSLQAAYEDGNTIDIDNNNRPVSINIGNYTGNALEVVGPTNLTGTLDASGAVSFADTLGVTGAATLSSTLGVTGAATLSDTLAVTGAATLSDTLGVTGNITASADVEVAGILDLNGSLDADVSEFDVLSSGALNLVAQSAPLNITASAGDVVITGSTIKLKGSFVASNINALAVSAGVAVGKAVTMTSVGLAEAQANAKDVIVLGVSADAMGNGDSAFGKIAEFGRVDAAVEANLSPAIAAGDKLYLSAATAGAVTNVAPTASDTTVFLMGVALAAPANGIVEMALRPQFLYSNY